jgi:Zn-dependent peptidase ImmA (M78 family)
MTQIGFAEALGVTRLTVHRYESGEVDPPEESLDRIARVLGFPAEFFSGPSCDEPNQHSASFRGLTEMTARERDSALAAGALAFMLDDWVHDRFELPAVDLADMRGEEPELAARGLRQTWAIGERPIKNMVHLLEAKGVRVFSLVEETRSVDAFSLWRDGKPYVFLNTIKTTERSRFDAAHELGHLVLHKHGGPGGKKAEEEANKFASTLLMPEADVKAIAPTVSNVRQILTAKKRWGVSAFALNYRLHKLGGVTDWQYRQFAIQLTEMGFRSQEPGGLPPEKSVIWQKVLDALRTEGMTKHSLAHALNLPVREIENLVFRLASLMTLDGGGAGRTSAQSRPLLRVVK